MKTVPRNVQVVAQDGLPALVDLPEELRVMLADIAGVAREGLLALSVATGTDAPNDRTRGPSRSGSFSVHT